MRARWLVSWVVLGALGGQSVACGGGAPVGDQAGSGAASVGADGGRDAGAPGAGGQAPGSGGSGATAGSGASGGGDAGEPGTLPLSSVCATEDSTNAWGPYERNGSNGEDLERDGGALTLGGVLHRSGFGVHAPSDLGFSLAGGCSLLTAIVGIDDEMRASGSVRFEVWGDGEQLFQSEQLTGASEPLPIEVDITGVSELRLVANDDGGNGSDHADWAEAKVTCAAPPPTDCAPPPPVIVPPSGFHLTWSDEFDVDGAPNPENWGFEEGFVRNEEAQWYQAENARVEAGYLIIEGRREQKPNPSYNPGATGGNAWKQTRQYAEYTSSSLHSRGKRSFQFGRFEMRGRIVATTGLWPAFWTLGNGGEWPSCGEIDILEYYNSRVHANVATGTATQWQAKWDSFSKLVSDFGDDDWDKKFHVWRMDWDDTQIRLYLDDALMNSSNLADMLNANGQSPFRQPHYILVNLAMGGVNGGSLSSTPLPTRYEVDYVRVFQAD